MSRASLWGWGVLCVLVGCAPVDVTTGPSEVQPQPILSVAREPTPPTATPERAPETVGSLSAEVVPQYRTVFAGKAGHMGVLVRLEGKDTGKTERPPLDLAIALDRSGSMSGDKILAVKQAAIDMLRELDPEDRISLVTYSSDVKVHSKRDPAGRARDRLRTEVLAIDADGGTALGPALDESIGLLRAGKRNDEVLAHVMLLSDGLANEGESNPDVLAGWASKAFTEGIGVSTLGVGIDYAEDLMTRLADAGGGRYHFIAKSDDVPRVLADEFAGLRSTVARSIELGIDPADPVKVTDVHGYPTTEEELVTIARVGAIAAAQRREILVEIDFTAPSQGVLPLGTFTIEFRDALADGAKRSITLEPTVEVSADAAIVEASERTEVSVRLAELQAAAELEKAMRAVEEGRYDEAKSMLDRASEQVRKKAAVQPSPVFDEALEELAEAQANVDQAAKSEASRKTYLKSNRDKVYQRGKK